MGYISFADPKPAAPAPAAAKDDQPTASSSKLAAPPAAALSSPPAAAAPPTLPSASTAPVSLSPSQAASGRSTGKRARVVSYQSDDDPLSSADEAADDDDDAPSGRASHETAGAAARKHARLEPPSAKHLSGSNGSALGARPTAVGAGAAKGKGREFDPGAVERMRAERDRLRTTRMELPIWAGQESITEAVKAHDTVVILGETGSGKTTQVPQFLLSLLPAPPPKGTGPSKTDPPKILVTQPRRIAALALSARVAAELGTPVGGRVGHAVRFDTNVSRQTRIVFATEGMVVRELLGDKLLSRYSIILVDEAHERSIATDVLLGSLKRIQQQRKRAGSGLPELKVVVMSATLDAERFSDFFYKCPILYVRGRQHAVKVYHALSDPDDHVDACVRTVLQLLVRPSSTGDILVFLTGQDDIDAAAQTLHHLVGLLPAGSVDVQVLQFMASTPPAMQAKVFVPSPPGSRKVILSTNVAETSITVPGVAVVVDAGLAKEKGYVSRRGTGIETLLVTRVSKSAAQQRTGRAGREGPGSCYRLYTKETYDAMAPSPLPEIQRSDLTQTVLQLKEMGVDDVQMFDFLDKPDPDFIAESLMALHGLGAIDNTLAVTALGRQMLKFPLAPAQARVLTASVARGCTADVLDILSLVNDSPIFLDPLDKRDEAAEARKGFAHRDGDHLTLLNVLRSYEAIPRKDVAGRKAWCRARFVNERNLKRAIQARDQMRTICEREGVSWHESKGDDAEPVLRCLVEGMFTKCAVWSAGEYRQVVGNSAVKIHPSSTLHNKRAPAILYDEIIHTTNTYARGVSQVHHSWLAELPMFNARP